MHHADFGFMPALTPPNTTMDGDGFIISHNSQDIDIYGCETTALVIGQLQGFLILNGDHRCAYRDLIPQGFDACLSYFMANVDQANARSEHKFLKDGVVTLPCRQNVESQE